MAERPEGAEGRSGEDRPRATEVKDTRALRGDGSPEGTGAAPGEADSSPRDARATDTDDDRRVGEGGAARDPDAVPRDDTPRDHDRRGDTAVAVGAGTATAATDDARTELLRVPGFVPSAPFAGWLAAWGAAALAAFCLIQAGVPLGYNFGIAEGGPGSDGFSGGLWLLVVQAGAFLFGGYVAARMARNRGITHALLAWVLAMIATGVDALALTLRDGGESVLAQLFLPFWEGTGLGSGIDAVIVLAIFAGGSLVGALVGGGIGSGANKAAKREVDVDGGGRRVLRRGRDRDAETVRT